MSGVPMTNMSALSGDIASGKYFQDVAQGPSALGNVQNQANQIAGKPGTGQNAPLPAATPNLPTNPGLPVSQNMNGVFQ